MSSPAYPTLAINSVCNIPNLAQENFHWIEKKELQCTSYTIKGYHLRVRFFTFLLSFCNMACGWTGNKSISLLSAAGGLSIMANHLEGLPGSTAFHRLFLMQSIVNFLVELPGLLACLFSNLNTSQKTLIFLIRYCLINRPFTIYKK